MASEIPDEDDGYPWLSWAMTGVFTLAGVLVVGLVVSVRNPRSQTVAQSGPADAANSKVQPAASTEPSPPDFTPTAGGVSAPLSPPPAPATNGPASSLPPSTTVKTGPESLAATGVPPRQDAVKQTAFVRAVADARAAMGHGNLAASKRNLQTAAANAQDPAEQAQLERLLLLQDYLEQFWDGIRSAVAVMQPIDEIVLSDSDRVAVIEASREELAVFREGRSQRCRIEALPIDLLTAITKSWFKPTAGSKLVIGAFQAMDSRGDRAVAARLWQEVIRGGESRGKLLLPELNIPRAADEGRTKPPP